MMFIPQSISKVTVNNLIQRRLQHDICKKNIVICDFVIRGVGNVKLKALPVENLPGFL